MRKDKNDGWFGDSPGDRGQAHPADPIRPQRLKLMWDYTAFPVWSVTGTLGGGMVAPETLPVSDGLRRDLQAWSDEWTDAMWGERGPDAPCRRSPSPEAFDRWNQRGRALLDRLRQELAPEFVVGYMNERTRQVEWPDEA